MRKITFILFLVTLFSCQRNNTWECEGDCWNGTGTKTFRDGGIEKGTWTDGELIGQGYQFFGKTSNFSGDFYEGEFDNGYNGYGKYYDASEDLTYEGYWKNGKSHGKGKMTAGQNSKYPNSYYDGEWKDGKRHGYGVKFWGEAGKWTNNIYKGEWKNDNADGFGRHDWADGSYYEGEWKNDDQHGKGVYTFPNGEKFEGEWIEGYCRKLAVKIYGENGASFVALLDEINRPYHIAGQKFLDATTFAIKEKEKDNSYQINFTKLKELHTDAIQKIDSVIPKLEEVPEFDEKIEYKKYYIQIVRMEQKLIKEFALWIELMENNSESQKLEQVNDKIYQNAEDVKNSQIKFEKIKKKFDRKHIK